MGDVRLYALGIDELRDLLCGSPEASGRLRSLAEAAYSPAPPAAPGKRTLLSRIGGPLVKHPLDGPVVRPGVPTGADLEALLAGHHLPTERLSAAWALVDLWLADASWGRLAFELDEPQMDEIDFQLSSGGVETSYALRRLFNDRLALPLRNAPGQVTGYHHAAHALGMRDAYRASASWLEPDSGALVARIADWLDGFESWCRDAAAAGRPAPDLIASYTG